MTVGTAIAGNVTIECVALAARDLQAGDLFSTRGLEYWAFALDKGSIGEKVYVRTHTDADTARDADSIVYRLTFTREGT